jgi:hypothetical protein
MAKRIAASDIEIQAPHVETAQAHMEQLIAMRESIPHFVIPTTKNEARRLSRAASVPPEFVECSASMTTHNPELARGGAADPNRTRGLMAYADAYDGVVNELEALTQFVRFSIIVARHQAGREALATYAIAKRLAQLPETAGLLPYVEDMRRALGGRRKKKAEAPVEPEPADAPAE